VIAGCRAGLDRPAEPAAKPGLGRRPTQVAQANQERPVRIDPGVGIEQGELGRAVDPMQAVAR
jgi:hypothetical protein